VPWNHGTGREIPAQMIGAGLGRQVGKKAGFEILSVKHTATASCVGGIGKGRAAVCAIAWAVLRGRLELQMEMGNSMLQIQKGKKMTDFALSLPLSLSLPLTMTVGYSTKQGQARSLGANRSDWSGSGIIIKGYAGVIQLASLSR
jgi:hypothetical protein